MKEIIIMPGGFHPFHAGHYALYQSAVKAFPGADVYVAATNDTSERPFPFAIKEKLAQVAGVPPGHFVQVKSPFGAEEITSRYDPNDTILIFIKSQKNSKSGSDPEGPFPAEVDPSTGKLPLVTRGPRKGLPVSNRLQYLKGNENNLQPMSQHSYLAYLPTVKFGSGIKSGSVLRKMWPTLDTQGKSELVMSMYPATQNNERLAATVVKMINLGMGGAEQVQKTEGKKMSIKKSVEENFSGAFASVTAPLGATRRRVKEVIAPVTGAGAAGTTAQAKPNSSAMSALAQGAKTASGTTASNTTLSTALSKLAAGGAGPTLSQQERDAVSGIARGIADADSAEAAKLKALIKPVAENKTSEDKLVKPKDKKPTPADVLDHAKRAREYTGQKPVKEDTAPRVGDTYTTSKGGTVTRTARGLKHTQSPDAGKDINPGNPSKVKLDRYKLHSQPRSMFSGDLSEAAETGLFPTNAAPIRVGSTGDLVKAWQWTLNKLGLGTAIDGKFGNETKQNTIEFQQSNSLPADGTVGSSTYSTANSVLQDKGITNNPFLQGVKAAVQRGYAKLTGALPNMPVAKTVFDFFKSKGYNDIQAAAFVGNFAHESGFSGSALNPNDAGSPSFGLAQWKLDRLEALKKFAAQQGTSYTDLGTQLNFVINELGRSHARANAALQATPNNLAGAVKAIQGKYEVGANYEPRFKYAQIALQQFAPETFASMTSQTPVSESAGQPLSVEQLATISDEALDRAYHYGRSSPGNTFGWQANLKSAAFAKKIIDSGVADIEKISDAIHRGWNVTAQAFVKDPMQFDDSKTMAPEKLQAKLAQREKLMTQQYAQLPEDEKEKDRVVARALLQAITGDKPGVTESSQRVDRLVTRSLRIMRGGTPADAIAALKTVLGEMEYNERPQFYDFFIKQMVDMYGQQSVAEGGPFSYGKPPRKGSVADLAAKHRKEQDRKTPPIEPRDQMVGNAKVTKDVKEEWSQKYKNSINCKHPRGFSQKAHCAGKRKHTESTVMEMTCPDCGMCKSHGTLSEIRKGQKDANGYTKCWPGKHAEGTKTGKNGGQVRNCVPNESVAESFHDSVTFEIDSENAFNHVMGRFNSRIDWDGEYMTTPRRYWGAIQELAHEAGGEAIEISDEHNMAEGEVTKTKTGLIHRATDKYGAGEVRDIPGVPRPNAWDSNRVDKRLVKNLDAGLGITWKNRGTKGIEIDDDEQDVKEATNDYFQRRKNEEDRIAGVKPPAKRTPQQTDYQKRRNREQQVGEAKQKPSAQERFNNHLRTKHGIDLDAMEKQWAERTKKIEAEIAALREKEKQVSESYYQFDEGWKSALAGAALAGAAALGGGAAHAGGMSLPPAGLTPAQAQEFAVTQMAGQQAINQHAAQQAGKIDYRKDGLITKSSLGHKLEYGIPVNAKGDFINPNRLPNIHELPMEEQEAMSDAYKTWLKDYLSRWPDARQQPDGSMQAIKPGLAPMYPK